MQKSRCSGSTGNVCALSRLVAVTILFAFVALLPGCSGSIDDSASSRDSDGDGLMDATELRLGTNPFSADTDGDGLPDSFEVFGLLATLRPPDQNIAMRELVDRNRNGLHAAIDNDDDGDGVHDGEGDFDNDGVSNAMEYYGYTYDKVNGFRAARYPTLSTSGDGSMTATQEPFDPFSLSSWQSYFKTDPTVASTDRDPYEDYEEITGAKKDGTPMDSSVQLPGTHPLIPAYPIIVVKLTGIDVTVNATISSNESKLSSNTWSEQTRSEDKTVTNWHKQANAEVDVSAKGASGKATAMISKDTTHTVDNTVTTNNSSFTQDQWSQAISTNTLQAASLKLHTKVMNLGTAVAKDVQPTVNLLIGGKTIKTIRFNSAIDILTAKGTASGTYPAGDSDWVLPEEPVSGDQTIWLSINELKSIMTGAPITLESAQIQAKVLGAAGDTDWNDYRAQIEGASAKISVDLGDGTVRDYFVWAPKVNPWTNAPDGPTITVMEAIMWATMSGFTPDGSAINIPRDDGTSLQTTLDGWRFGFDEITFNKNILNDTNTNLWNVPLSPGAAVLAKAPPQGALAYPTIHWANLAQTAPSSVSAYVDDYFAVSKVLFFPTSSTADAQAIELTDSDGDHIYTAALSADYRFSGTEKLVATNDEGRQATYTGPFLPPPDNPNFAGANSITFDSSDMVDPAKIDQRHPDNSATKINLNISAYGVVRPLFVLKGITAGSSACNYGVTVASTSGVLGNNVAAHFVGLLTHDEYLALHEEQIQKYEFELQPANSQSEGSSIGELSTGWVATQDPSNPTLTPNIPNASAKNAGSTWALRFTDGKLGKIRFNGIRSYYYDPGSWCGDAPNYNVTILNFDYIVYQH